MLANFLRFLPFINLENLCAFRKVKFQKRTAWLMAVVLGIIYLLQATNLYFIYKKMAPKENFGIWFTRDLRVSVFSVKGFPAHQNKLKYPDRLISIDGVPLKTAGEYYKYIQDHKERSELTHTFENSAGVISKHNLTRYRLNENDDFVHFFLPWGSTLIYLLVALALVLVLRNGRSLYLVFTTFVVGLWISHYPDWESSHAQSFFTANLGFVFCFLLIIGGHILYDLVPTVRGQYIINIFFSIWVLLVLIHNGFIFFTGEENPYLFIASYGVLLVVCIRGTLMPIKHYFYPRPKVDAFVWLPIILVLIVLALAAVSPLLSIFSFTPIQIYYLHPLGILFPYIALAAEYVSNLGEYNIRLREEVEQIRGMLVDRTRLNTTNVILAGISHEILNPLHIIFLNRELLDKHFQEFNRFRPENSSSENLSAFDRLSSHMKESLERVSDSAERIERIVDEIRELRKTELKLREALIGTEINRAVQHLESEIKRKRLRIAVEIQKDIKFKFDPFKINQVLVNVLSNAICASKEDQEIIITTHSGKDMVSIEISDHGSGMDAQTLERAFEPFFTTQDPGKGMGLGLFICSQIMRLHDGSIDIDSFSGRGTKVTLKIPTNLK